VQRPNRLAAFPRPPSHSGRKTCRRGSRIAFWPRSLANICQQRCLATLRSFALPEVVLGAVRMVHAMHIRKAIPTMALSRQRKVRVRARTVAPSLRADAAPAALGRLRLPSLSRSMRQCSRGSGLVRPPAIARAAAGIARWRRCAPPASGQGSLARDGGCFSLRSA